MDPIQGFVERIRPDLVEGWTSAMMEADQPVFELIAGDCRVTFQPDRWVRHDVAEVHGEAYLPSGFRWTPGPIASSLISAARNEALPIKIGLNGQLLSIIPSSQPLVEAVNSDELPSDFAVGASRALSWGIFRIQGITPPHVAISLRSNGRIVDCRLFRDFKPCSDDVALAFELEIQPSVWSGTAPGQPIHIELLFDDTAAGTFILDCSVISLWLERIAGLKNEADRQYYGLLALEHLKSSEIIAQIEQPALQAALTISQALRLQDFVFPKGPPGCSAAPVTSRSPSSLAMDRAMGDLNDTLGVAEAGQSLIEIVSSVLSRQRLSGEAYTWFSSLITQLACERGDFHALLPLLDPDFLKGASDAEAPEHQALALPVLLARGNLAEAVNMLRNLVRKQQQGWLHTGCIRYALAESRRMLSAGLADASDVNALREVFIDFVDATNGDWFTRHHDMHIMRAMADELAIADTMPDWLREQLTSAAIRNFGLSPAFWVAIDQSAAAPPERIVLHARRLFLEIQTLIEHPRPQSEGMGRAVGAIRWFLGQGNLDARVFARELLVNALPRTDDATLSHLKELFAALLEVSGKEWLRLFFHPHLTWDCVNQLAPGCADDPVQLLRVASEQRAYTTRQQYAAAAALTEAIAATGEARCLALGNLAFRAAQFVTAGSRALGVDLLVSAAALAKDADLPWQHSLTQARRMALAALGQWRADAPLPAPLLAGISRLSVHEHPEFVSVASEISRIACARAGRDVVGITPEASVRNGGRGWPHDTLFIVFPSHFRGDALKDARLGWQKELAARGVSCLALREGERVALDGDRLSVPAGAPQTILLDIFRWVLAQTDMQYLVLVDEHCEIHVHRFLDSLCNRKHHYYGAKLSAAPGSMNRRGGNGALDRSPEPSEWIDGSGAVSLSRAALESLFRVIERREGQRLLACSRDHFKLLGDLLALAGIRPEDEGYFYCRRETAAGGLVGRGRGDNAVFPGPASPTMVFRPASTAEGARQKQEAPWPPRIWPTCDIPSLSHNANQLELLSDTDKVRRLLTEPVAVVAVMRNEMIMLPHFLAHYRKLGVRAFLITDNFSDDGTLDYLAEQPDVILFSTDTEYRYSHFGVSWQQAMLGNYCLGKWVIVADADEFLVYRDCEHRLIGEFIDDIAQHGCDAAAVYMIDMYPWGDLGNARFDQGDPFSMAPYFDRDPLIELRFGGGTFSNSRNFVSALRHRVAPTRINAYVSQKFAVFRYGPWVRLGEGLHYASNLRCTEEVGFFAHFKYHAGFEEKVRIEVSRGQHFNNAEEYSLYAGMLAEGGGNFGSEGISMRYEGSHSFYSILERKRQTS
jgi:hypothetical protein